MSYIITFPEDYVPPVLPMRDEWCAALRSGNYKQGSNHLCFDGKYCCLGVLSDIQGRLNLSEYGVGFDGDKNKVLSFDNPIYNILMKNGEFPKGVEVEKCFYGAVRLTECNDTLLLNFNEIADIIERIWAA